MYFENFKNDTVDSLVFRYPGTTVYTDATSLNTHGLPLAQGTAANQYSTFTPTFTPTLPILNIALLFNDLGTESRSTKATLNLCNLLEITQNSDEVIITGPNATGTPIHVFGIYIRPSTKSLNVKVNMTNNRITILADGQTVVLNRSVDWALSFNPLLYVKGDIAFRYGTFPTSLSLFTITDKVTEGMLDPNSLSVELSNLTYVSSEGMGFTTTSFDEDIKGNAPLRSDPAVYAANETGKITYANNIPPAPNNKQLLAQQLYLGGRSSTQNPLYVNNNYVTDMENRPKAIPPQVVDAEEITLEFRE